MLHNGSTIEVVKFVRVIASTGPSRHYTLVVVTDPHDVDGTRLVLWLVELLVLRTISQTSLPTQNTGAGKRLISILLLFGLNPGHIFTWEGLEVLQSGDDSIGIQGLIFMERVDLSMTWTLQNQWVVSNSSQPQTGRVWFRALNRVGLEFGNRHGAGPVVLLI